MRAPDQRDQRFGVLTWSMSHARILGLLTTADAADLTNTEDPTIVIQFGCWNTYFPDPTNQSLGSALLTEQGGASAVLGATTLTSSVHDAMFGPPLMNAVSTSGTVGAALTAAKHDLPTHRSARGGGRRGAIRATRCDAGHATSTEPNGAQIAVTFSDSPAPARFPQGEAVGRR